MDITHETLKKCMDIKDRIFINKSNLKNVKKGTKLYKELVDLINKDKKELEEIEKKL